jgi:hypothetical protein
MELPAEVHELIRLALAEDIGAGDVTVRYFVPAEARARAVILAKEPGVLAGVLSPPAAGPPRGRAPGARALPPGALPAALPPHRGGAPVRRPPVLW